MLEKIFAENDVRANVNRAAFENNGIRALDLMSSPGSGRRPCWAPRSTSTPTNSQSALSKATSPST